MAQILLFILIISGQLSSVFCHGPFVEIYIFYIAGVIMLLMLIIIIYLCVKLYKLKRGIVRQTDIVPRKHYNNIGSTQTLNSGITEINEYAPQIPVLNAEENKMPIIIKKSFASNMPIIQKHQMDKVVEEVLKRKQRSESGTFKELMALAKQKSSYKKSVTLNESDGNSHSRGDILYGDIGICMESINNELESELKDETKVRKNIDEIESIPSSQKNCNDVCDSSQNSITICDELSNSLVGKCYDELPKLLVNCDEVYDIVPNEAVKCEDVYDIVPSQAVKCEEVFDIVPNQAVKSEEVYDIVPNQVVKCEEIYDIVPNQAVKCDQVYDTVPTTPVKCFGIYTIKKSDEVLTSPYSAKESHDGCNTLSCESGNSYLDGTDKATVKVDVYDNITSASKILNTKVILDEDTNYTIIIGDASRQGYVNAYGPLC